MIRWVWWLIRCLVYSLIIFAILYVFVYINIIPDLWQGYSEMFTINAMIAVSVACGFVFVSLKDIIFRKENVGVKYRR